MFSVFLGKRDQRCPVQHGKKHTNKNFSIATWFNPLICIHFIIYFPLHKGGD